MSEKVAHQAGDLIRLLVEREVPGIEDVDFRLGQITLICGGLGNHEGRVVLAPNDQRGRLMLPQPSIPNRIAGDAGAVIVEQVDLDVVLARTAQEGKLISPAVGILKDRYTV